MKTLGDLSEGMDNALEAATTADVLNIRTEDLNFAHIKDLSPYLALAENIRDVNAFTAPSIIGKLAVGLRKAGDYLAIAKYQYTKAYHDRKRAEAVAALDEFPKYIAAKKAAGEESKATDATREYYVRQHPLVISAVDREAFFEAIQEQVYTMKTEILMSITTARQIAYGFKDANSMPTFTESSKD